MKKNKLFLRSALLTFLITISVFLCGNFIFAQSPYPSPLKGLDQTTDKIPAYETQVNNYSSNFLQSKAGQIVGTVLSFVGVLFLILMIYAGILWMTAQGNDQQVAKAKGLLINGVIGLIIVFAAYAITSFIGQEILR